MKKVFRNILLKLRFLDRTFGIWVQHGRNLVTFCAETRTEILTIFSNRIEYDYKWFVACNESSDTKWIAIEVSRIEERFNVVNSSEEIGEVDIKTSSSVMKLEAA